MRVLVLEEAKQDLLDGARFYDSQQAGLGDYFFDTLCSDIESLHLFAGIHPKHWGSHRVLSKRFPYAIYYEMNGDVAIVHAVLDCRQDPRRIEDRLRR